MVESASFLPPEVWHRIAFYAELETHSQLGRTSRRLRQHAMASPTWRHQLNKTLQTAPFSMRAAETERWMEICRQNAELFNPLGFDGAGLSRRAEQIRKSWARDCHARPPKPKRTRTQSPAISRPQTVRHLVAVGGLAAAGLTGGVGTLIRPMPSIWLLQSVIGFSQCTLTAQAGGFSSIIEPASAQTIGVLAGAETVFSLFPVFTWCVGEAQALLQNCQTKQFREELELVSRVAAYPIILANVFFSAAPSGLFCPCGCQQNAKHCPLPEEFEKTAAKP